MTGKPGTDRSPTDDDVEREPMISISPRFLRGLTLGALVGAAIAGSAIWDRMRRRDEAAPPPPGRAEPTTAHRA